MNLGCTSETCCTRLAGNAGRKKVAICAPSYNCRAISSQLRHVSTIGKNLFSSNTSATCPGNMVNFGLLSAEIGSGVWGTLANFNRFHLLAALLHGSQSIGHQPNFAALNRGRRHLYLTGRPSRWALAHISSIEISNAGILG